MKRLATMFLVSVLAACVGTAPTEQTGGGGGAGDGTGGGGGGGSGSGSDPSGGGSSSLTATSFLATLAQKYCDEAFSCKASFPTNLGITFADAFGASPQECVSNTAAVDMPAVVESEIVAGKIHFNATDAASCVAGYSFPACPQFWASGPIIPTACSTALVGTIPDGGACIIDYDCSNSHAYCDNTSHKCTVSGARTTPTRQVLDFSLMN